MENSKIILSIGVPVYNVDKYLRKCVESLLAQDLSPFEYEIILVDDGSTDTCPQICDEYAAAYNNIHVIHQPNAGLSAARNTSIAAARGTYLMFIDSDDYVEPNVLAGLLAQMKCDNLDVLRYRLQYVNPQYEVYNPYKSDPFKGNDYSEIPTDGVSFLNSRMSTACYAWQFLLRRDLIIGNQTSNIIHNTSIHNTFEKDSCLFNPGIFFEDTDWTPRMLCRAKRVASTNTIVYNYLQREGSITNAVNRSKLKKVLDDKIRLVGEMKRQAKKMEQRGLINAWFSRMIADTIISIIGILSVDFYNEKDEYLAQIKALDIFPIQSRSFKARLINISAKFAIQILHIKNKNHVK